VKGIVGVAEAPRLRHDPTPMRLGPSIVAASAIVAGCAPAAPRPFLLGGYPPQLAADASRATSPLLVERVVASPAYSEGSRLELGRDRGRLAVPRGRFVIPVALPPGRTVVLGLSGPPRAARWFEVLGRGALRRLATSPGDGELPSFVTFVTPALPEPLLVVVDAEAPLTLHRLDLGDAALGGQRLGETAALPLVGFRAASSSKAGYVLGTASRYAFLRADAAEALRVALRAVRRRFGREPIAVGDATQWNGARPASDRRLPRHVSHHEGRDVDLALPGLDGDSSIRHRCEVALSAPDRATCREGTARALDAERLAYLLAQLVEGPSLEGPRARGPRPRQAPLAPVELVFADAEVIAAVRAALRELQQRRWIRDEAVAFLADDAKLRASPWHTDHVHVRFAGAAAVVPDALRAIAPSP